MDCRTFLEFLWFTKPKYDGLTQPVIPMDSLLGFLFALVNRRLPGKNFNEI